jgi:uncharacterized protein YecE (DUF72 family)
MPTTDLLAKQTVATLDALNEVCGPFLAQLSPNFALSITGTFVGTLALQWAATNDGALPVDADWRTNKEYTTTANEGVIACGLWWRVKATAWTSGSAVVTMSQGLTRAF